MFFYCSGLSWLCQDTSKNHPSFSCAQKLHASTRICIIEPYTVIRLTTIPMLEKLFGSRTRVKLLRLFLTHPDQEHFVREIARIVGEQINSVRRELMNLETLGILKSVEKDKKKYYIADQEFVLFPELRTLIVKSRFTLERSFIEAIQHLGQVHYLALMGYFVNDDDSPVDLLVVGTLNRPKLNRLLNKFKEQFGPQLRFTLMTKDEYQYRMEITDKFLYEIMNTEKIVVLDTINKQE
jgi:predicted transcriptional regulator